MAGEDRGNLARGSTTLLALAALMPLSLACTGELSGDVDGVPRGAAGDDSFTGSPGGSGGNSPFDPGTGGTGTGGNEGGAGGTPDFPGPGGSGGTPAPPPPGSIAMFVAQGHAGRTTVSCDDGRSWVANQSDDDALRCFDPYDCDHDPGAGRGITWGDGWFFVTFGWGPPGGIERSRDGVSWETVLSGTTFGGVAYGQGRLLAASGAARYSDDQGDTFEDVADSALNLGAVRRSSFLPGANRFLMAASDQSSAEIAVSADGTTWSLPDSLPAGCGGGMQTEGGFAYGNGVIVAIGSDSVACRSTDGGANWTSTGVGGSISSHIVWNGSEFMAWGSGTLYRSTDGASWTSTGTTPGNLYLGAVAVSDRGTIVAVRGGWGRWYEEQEFYRSADGVTWETLADGTFAKSHPVRFITFGYGARSDACP